MKVRCNKIILPMTGEEVETHPSVRVGSMYLAIEFFVDYKNRPQLRIVDDSGTPSIWHSSMFSTVDDRLPGDWGLQINDDGRTYLAPRRFLARGFWEDYFNDKPNALVAYREEVRLMESAGDAEESEPDDLE